MRKFLSILFAYFDAFFNRIFSNRYNPIYRTGSIAILMLIIATVSGIYLTFFYSLKAPYEAVSAVHHNIWFGRWVRSLHRYASDIMMIAVFLHMIRMYIQRKTNAPRILAWISGVGLLGLLFITGITGFILVWDRQALSSAMASAEMIDYFSVLLEPTMRAFSGKLHPPASFFFLNLFIHVVIPLVMIFLLWVHTAKMARATWFPHRKLLWTLVGLVVAFSILWPVRLENKADPLALLIQYPINWLYHFWLPLAHGKPSSTWLVGVTVFLILLLIPWIDRWTNRSHQLPVAFNDDKNCQGCTQCVQDCPYEAIKMVPRKQGEGSELVAEVNPSACVSCGICSASCEPFTTGLPGYKGRDQLALAKAFMQGHGHKISQNPDSHLLIACENQGKMFRELTEFSNKTPGFDLYKVPCMGSVHATVISSFAQRYKTVIALPCPERNCHNKDAAELFAERISGKRAPTLLSPQYFEKVHSIPSGEGEFLKAKQKIFSITGQKEKAEGLSSGWHGKNILRVAAQLAVIISVLAAIYVLGNSRYSVQALDKFGTIRINLRINETTQKVCQAPVVDKNETLAKHMRPLTSCQTQPYFFKLSLEVDDKPVVEEILTPTGRRHDRPIFYYSETPVMPGNHKLKITLWQSNEPGMADPLLVDELSNSADVEAHRALLLDFPGKPAEWTIIHQTKE